MKLFKRQVARLTKPSPLAFGFEFSKFYMVVSLGTALFPTCSLGTRESLRLLSVLDLGTDVAARSGN